MARRSYNVAPSFQQGPILYPIVDYFKTIILHIGYIHGGLSVIKQIFLWRLFHHRSEQCPCGSPASSWLKPVLKHFFCQSSLLPVLAILLALITLFQPKPCRQSHSVFITSISEMDQFFQQHEQRYHLESTANMSYASVSRMFAKNCYQTLTFDARQLARISTIHSCCSMRSGLTISPAFPFWNLAQYNANIGINGTEGIFSAAIFGFGNH